MSRSSESESLPPLPGNFPDKIYLPKGMLLQGSKAKGPHFWAHDQPQLYLSHCAIPDVDSNTIVVAACAGHDLQSDGKPGLGMASPTRDGWFFSDWALWHHILRDLIKDQVWIAGESPEHLVKKYGQYVQGDPGTVTCGGEQGKPSDRRVVLSEAQLPSFADVVVVPQKELRDRVLQELGTACERAIQANPKDPARIVLMLFGHGNEVDGSIDIGYQDPDILNAWDEVDQDTLSPDDVEKIIRKGGQEHVPVTIFSTSCFAGSWACIPNITTFLASDFRNVSNAWASMPDGTTGGGQATTAIVDAMARSQIPGYSGFSTQTPEHLTLAAEIKSSTEWLTKRHDVRYKNRMTFSTENDEWAVHFGERMGFPLADYLGRWLCLPKVPGKSELNVEDEQEPEVFKTGGRTGRRFTVATRHRYVAKLARKYLQSYPNTETIPQFKQFHEDLKAWLAKETEPLQRFFRRAEATIKYRFYVMTASDAYKKALGFDFPVSCRDADLKKLINSYEGQEQMLITEIEDELRKWPLFDQALGKLEGEVIFPKGYTYLAIVFVHNKIGLNQVGNKLEPLFKNHDPDTENSGFTLVPGTSRYSEEVARYAGDPYIQNSLRIMAKSMRRQFRELSPIKGTPTKPKRSSIVSGELFTPPSTSPAGPSSGRKSLTDDFRRLRTRDGSLEDRTNQQ